MKLEIYEGRKIREIKGKQKGSWEGRKGPKDGRKELGKEGTKERGKEGKGGEKKKGRRGGSEGG